MLLSTGTRLGSFEIRSLLGAGGMGEVYLAEDLRLGRKVALKVLSEELTRDPDRLRRFAQEARAVSTLNHPNIPTIYEVGEEAGRHYVVTEFIDGATLRERLAEAPMNLPEVLDIAIQVASALEEAHAAGIVHRDIKPENIVLRRDGRVMVGDFGLAKLREHRFGEGFDYEAALKSAPQTEPGVVIGTTAYMSPEQIEGMAVDARTDLWSLGAVLYEIITGHHPFAGKNSIETSSLILREQPPPLTRYVGDVPGELERVINKALRKNRDERYQTAKELLTDLHRVRKLIEPHFETLVTPRVTTFEPFATVQRTTLAPKRVQQSTAGRSAAEFIIERIRSHKLGAFAAITAMLLVVVSAIAYFYHPGRVIREAALRSELEEATALSESSIRDRYYAVEPISVRLPDGKSVNGYDANQVIAVVKTGRENLAERLRAPELVGLKDYVVLEYPVPNPEAFERIKDNKTDRVLITEDSKNAAFENVFQFIARIRALIDQRRLSIDLTVSSLPDGATFDLWASVGPHRTTTTNNLVDNVYRGFYRYKVTKGGFKLIEDSLNLVDSDGRKLDCFFNQEKEQDGPHPCKLR